MTDVAAEPAPAEAVPAQSVAQPEVAPKPGVKVISPEREKVVRESRPTLPGLVNDRGHDALDEVLIPRGKDGKFLSRQSLDELSERELLGLDDPEDDDKVVGKGDAPPLPKSDATAAKPAKFVFDGEEYASEDAFKQNIKSLRGQYKSFEQNRSKLIGERDFGYESGWKWKAESDKKDEIIKALEQRLGGTPATGQQNPQAATNLQSRGNTTQTPVDLANLESILTDDVGREFEARAIGNGGLPDAGKFLVQATLKTVMEKIVPALEQRMQGQIRPFQQAASDQQAYEGVQQTIRAVSELRHPNGGAAFPEVEDGETIAKVAQMWVDSGHPRETAFTQHGLIAAISLYRTMKSFGTPFVVPNPQPAQRPNANASAPAATLDAGGEHNARPLAGKVDENLSPGARALVAAFRMDEPMIDPILGFAKNRKR